MAEELISNKPNNTPGQFCPFREVEETLHLTIPHTLQNILKINGFDNEQLLANFSDSNLEEIELFCRSNLCDIIEENELHNYLGIYSKKPDKFVIVSGHKIIINMISKYFKQKLSKINNIPSINKQGVCATRSPINRNDDEHRRSESKSTIKLNTLTEEESSAILNTIKEWTKQHMSNDKWSIFEKHFNEIKIITNDEPNACKIECFCKGVYKIPKLAKIPGGAKRWIYSNFQTHLKKHFELKVPPNFTPNKKGNAAEKHTDSSLTISSTNRLTNYFKRVIPSELKSSSAIISYSGNSNSKISSTSTCPVDSPYTSTLTIESTSKGDSGSSSFDLKNSGENNNCTEDCMIVENSDVLNLKTKSYVKNKNVNVIQNILLNPSDVPSNVDNDQDDILNINLPVTNQSLDQFNDIIDKSKEPKSDNHVSKWKNATYQRCERKKRARSKSIDDKQTLITDYYYLVEQVSNIMNKDATKMESILATFQNTLQTSATNKKNVEDRQHHMSNFLRQLMDVSIKNSQCPENRSSYHHVTKQFAIYLYYIGGRLLYETLHSNLKGALPSISTLNRFLDGSRTITEEGIFDFKGLLKFLTERNLPKVIWVSEDGTRITGKIEYDNRSNKILGFVLPLKNGLPQRNAFIATSEHSVRNFFNTEEKAHYAYVIIAQPLSKGAPAFCLSLFGTNNKFTYRDVIDRWNYMKKEAAGLGITIAGFSADGDTRLLKSMRINTKLPSQSEKWPWYQIDSSNSEEVYIQDTTHILTKMRTRLLKDGILLPFGNCTASVYHLFGIIDKVPKDKHLLTPSHLKPDDKMNFSAAEKMCSDAVIFHLKAVPNSQGTIAYLRLMRYILTSFLDRSLDLATRVYNIWYATFFLRLWRFWIKESKNHTIQDNFLSTNCYLCIEINAHGLLKLITQMKEKKLDPSLFNICNFSSQPCEQLFRAARSMTSTYSTVINFSIKDLLHRIDRIKAINSAILDLESTFTFPREQKRSRRILQENVVSNEEVENLDILEIVERSLDDAITDMKDLGIEINDPLAYLTCDIPIMPQFNSDEGNEGLSDDQDIETISIENSEVNEIQPDETEGEILKLAFDSEDSQGDTGLKDYSKTISEVEASSPYIVIKVGSKTKIVKKSSFCWLLDESDGKVSTDRMRRFFVNSRKKRLVKTKTSEMRNKTGDQENEESTDEYSTETEISSGEIEYHDTSDSDDFKESEEEEQEEDTEKLKASETENLNVKDFVVVELISKKCNKARFVAEIRDMINTEKISFTCSFLRKKKCNGVFSYVYPDVPDEAVVEKNEIIVKLPPPLKLRRGGLLFDKHVLIKYNV